METALVIAGVLVVLVAAGGWWLYRRHKQVVGDDQAAWSAPAEAPPEDAGPPPLLDRDALLHGRRPFNPSGWDDSPDEPGGSDDDDFVPDTDGEELPTHFDRDFLAQRRRTDPPED